MELNVAVLHFLGSNHRLALRKGNVVFRLAHEDVKRFLIPYFIHTCLLTVKLLFLCRLRVLVDETDS